MPVNLTIEGKRASATVFVSNLILRGGFQAIFLTAYGPSQEIRAFAQILSDGGSRMESGETTVFNFMYKGALRIIPKLANGYSALYVIPTGMEILIGDSEEDCFEIYSRILDQKQFVHRDWYRALFNLAQELPPLVGTKKCFIPVGNVEEQVIERVQSGEFKMPAPTAELIIEKREDLAA
jgi:hypothetical protein